jgi:hypothetical protein
VLVNRTRDEIPADDAAERVEEVTVSVVVDAARRLLAES